MPKKIIIIDDEKSIRQTLREILEYEKYSVYEADNGAKGLEMMTNELFDVVLCDIKMPEMDGLEVLEKAQQLDQIPQFIIKHQGNFKSFWILPYHLCLYKINTVFLFV